MAEEPEYRRRYRRRTLVVILVLASVIVPNIYFAVMTGSLFNTFAVAVAGGVLAGIIWSRHRILNPPPLWGELTVNGQRIAKFRVIEFPAGTQMDIGMMLGADPETGKMALLGIEAVTSIMEKDDEA